MNTNMFQKYSFKVSRERMEGRPSNPRLPYVYILEKTGITESVKKATRNENTLVSSYFDLRLG